MKITLKLFIPIAVFTIVFSLLGIYVLMELNKINLIEHEIMEANQISQLALDFNLKKFQTQLEIWEYAHEPSQIRLDEFNAHRITLHELLDQLEEAVSEEADYAEIHPEYHGLYNGGLKDMNQIISNMQIIDDEWNVLLDNIDKYRTVKESGASDEELKQFDSIIHQRIIQNEDLFYKLEFNKKIDDFVSSQENLTHNLDVKNEQILSNFTASMYVLIPVTISANMIINGFFSKRLVKSIEKLRNITKEISLGNLNMRIKIKGNDEIAELSSDVNIMQDNLLRQKKELIKNEKINALGNVTSSLAHNLKNPLSVIKAATSIIETTSNSVDEKTQERLNLIKVSTENMLNQIEDILDFVKQKPLELKETSFSEILNNAINNLEKPERIKINLPEKDIKIKCDSSKLEVVLMNMITNSIESIKGDGRIAIDLSQNKRESVIEITDTGSIDSKDLEKVFDVLYTTKPTGTGLGLSYCKSVIEQHGGSIEISKNPTKFTIILPR